MILAAGLGTRLGPLTKDTPKALIPIAGVPMLERVARRLITAGADRLIINTHHHARQIEDYVRARDGFGVEVAFSPERDHPLETGGALRLAAPLFRGDEPFFLHNADILSDVPLERMYERHQSLATLAVMHRESSRQLLFDDGGLLGREDRKKDLRVEARESIGEIRRLAFGGIHVISPDFLSRIEETGVFSILDPYLRLAGAGARIDPFIADGYRWLDIGKPDQLAEAEDWLERQAIQDLPVE